jgi:hypothetical protein
LRQFAAAWLVFFLAYGIFEWLARGHTRAGLVLCILAVVVGPVGWFRPPAIRWLFVGWMTLAFPIGWAVSQLALLVLFYGMLTPMGLFFRMRGRDMLGRKPAPSRQSFWIPKTTPSDVRSYLRQY